jgi:hypothetical protein
MGNIGEALSGMGAAIGSLGTVLGGAGAAVGTNFAAAGAVHGGGFKALGLDPKVGAATGIAAVLAGPLFPIAQGIGLLVGIAKKIYDNSEVAKAATESVNKASGSVGDIIMFGFLYLMEKTGILVPIVEGLRTGITEFKDKVLSWLDDKTDKINSIRDGILNFASTISTSLAGWLPLLVAQIKTITDPWMVSFSELVTFAKGIWEGMKNIGGNLANAFNATPFAQSLHSLTQAINAFLTSPSGGLMSAAQVLKDAVTLQGKFSPTQLVDWTKPLDLTTAMFTNKFSFDKFIDLTTPFDMSKGLFIKPIPFTDLLDMTSKPKATDLIDTTTKFDISKLFDFSGFTGAIDKAVESITNALGGS